MKNRKRNRMKGFDYASNNLYFVTICVQNMVCCLGEIVISEGANCDLPVHEVLPVVISEGANRDLPVQEMLPNKKSKKMMLNQYGLVVEERLIWLENQYKYIILHQYVVMPNHVHAIIEIDSLKIKNEIQQLSNEIKIKSLSSLIGAFKTTASKKIHELGFLNFSWQRSFHDSIIRNQKSYTNISHYIVANPDNWKIELWHQ